MEEKKKSNKGLVIVIIILVILLLGSVGYICYDKGVFDSFLGKEEPKPEEKEKKLSEEEVKKLHESLIAYDADLYFAKKMNINSITADEIMPYILMKYALDNGIIANMEGGIRIIADCGSKGTHKFDDNKVHLCGYDGTDENSELAEISKSEAISVSKADVDAKIKEVFNTDRVFELDDYTIFGGYQNDFYFIYSKEDSKFYVVMPVQSGDAWIYTKDSKTIKTEQKNGSIYIYDKVIRCSGDHCFNKASYDAEADVVVAATKKYQNDYVIDKKIIKDSDDQGYNIDFDYIYEKYGEKFNTYKTTFKKASDGKYYWYSSEVVTE